MHAVASITASVIIFLASVVGMPAQPSQPASQPVSQPASFNGYPLKSATLWATETLDILEVQPASNVRFEFTNESNCGAELSAMHLGGCTTTEADGSYTVRVSPKLAYTAWGNHILMHELAHTMGAGECEAEAYAHQFEDANALLWSYPECA